MHPITANNTQILLHLIITRVGILPFIVVKLFPNGFVTTVIFESLLNNVIAVLKTFRYEILSCEGQYQYHKCLEHRVYDYVLEHYL